MSEFKYTQAIVVRKDIEIPKGKLAVQVAHASVGSFLNDYYESNEDILDSFVTDWFKEGQRKIVFKVNNLNDLYDIQALADEHHIRNYLVEDFACTVFKEPTVTCIGLGPVSIRKMDEITKDLRLY